MSLATASTITAVGIGAALFEAVANSKLTNNPTTKGVQTDGSVFAKAQNLMGISPGAEFSVLDPAGVLDVLDLTGESVASVGIGNLAFYTQSLAKGGTRDASGTKSLAVQGIIAPVSLSCAQGDDAVLAVKMLATSDDGTTAPFVDSSAVPTLTDSEQARYGLGPVIIGSTTLKGVTSVEIDFGNSLQSKATDGNHVPSFSWNEKSDPKIVIRGCGDDWRTTCSYLGAAIEHATSSVFFKKRVRGGTYHDTEGFGFTAAGRVDLTEIGGTSGQAAETAIVISTCMDAAGLDPLVYSAV